MPPNTEVRASVRLMFNWLWPDLQVQYFRCIGLDVFGDALSSEEEAPSSDVLNALS